MSFFYFYVFVHNWLYYWRFPEFKKFKTPPTLVTFVFGVYIIIAVWIYLSYTYCSIYRRAFQSYCICFIRVRENVCLPVDFSRVVNNLGEMLRRKPEEKKNKTDLALPTKLTAPYTVDCSTRARVWIVIYEVCVSPRKLGRCLGGYYSSRDVFNVHVFSRWCLFKLTNQTDTPLRSGNFKFIPPTSSQNISPAMPLHL